MQDLVKVPKYLYYRRNHSSAMASQWTENQRIYSMWGYLLPLQLIAAPYPFSAPIYIPSLAIDMTIMASSRLFVFLFSAAGLVGFAAAQTQTPAVR